MKRMAVLIGIAALAASFALAFRSWVSEAPVEAPKHPAQQHTPVDVRATLAPIFEAEKIEDPLQRCLAYPAPRGAHWSRSLIEALCADRTAPTMSWSDFETAIENGEAAKLDARLDALVRDYFAQRAREVQLQYAYSPFGPTARARALIERWLAQTPDSAHARMARGLYELAMARDARGEDTIGNTPERDIGEMSRWLEKATGDFQRALSIEPRIMPAYSGLIEIAKLNGDERLAQDTIRRAIAVDPANYDPRALLVSRYDPRWGGSFDEMDRVAASATTLTAQNPRLVILKALALSARGMPSYFAHDYAAALKHFDAGLAEGPESFYLHLAAYAAGRSRDFVKATELVSQRIRFFPTDASAWLDRSYYLAQLGLDPWAESDLLQVLRDDPTNVKALRRYTGLLIQDNDVVNAEQRLRELLVLDPDDDWAIRSLAWLYSHRLGRLDDAVALIDGKLVDQPESGELWLMKVRAFDGVDGDPRMREAVENFLRYVDSSSQEQRNAVAGARRWLAAHPSAAATP